MDVTREKHQFWEILETNFQTQLSDSLKNIFNVCGFSHPTAFLQINEDEIKKMETFVRNDLLNILNSTKRIGSELTDNDLRSIYGFYVDSKENFSFILGEIKQIQIMSKFVTEKINSDGLHYFGISMKRNNKTKFRPKGTFESAVGVIYGNNPKREDLQKAQVTSNTSESSPIDTTGWAEKLFRGAVKLSHEFKINNPDSKAFELTRNMINVEITESNDIRAHVQCIFCQSPRKVYCRITKKSCTWLLANLKKHLGICSRKHVIAEEYLCDDNDSETIKPQENTFERTIEMQIVPENLTIESEENSQMNDYKDLLTAQISIQIIKLENTMALNNEAVETCQVSVGTSDDSIEVFKIADDGNCLFSAVSHQIHLAEIDSKGLKDLTIKLRKDVVAFIKDHLPSYENDLKHRLLDKQLTVTDLKTDCIQFLNDCLEKDCYWGGTESMRAITELYKLNVIVFSEKGHCYFAIKFNPEYERTIMLAYRLADPTDEKNTSRNHYDSVATLNDEIISSCATSLIDSYLKMSHLCQTDKLKTFQID